MGDKNNKQRVDLEDIVIDNIVEAVGCEADEDDEELFDLDEDDI